MAIKSLFVLQSQKSSCSTVVDSCQSWILPVAAAVLAIHHRGLWCKAAPFLFFFFFFRCDAVPVCCSFSWFISIFQYFILSRSMVPVFSSPSQLVLAVVTCCMGGAVVLLGSAAVKLTQKTCMWPAME